MNTTQNEYIEEEITIAEFAERFLSLADFSTPMEFNIEDSDVEIFGKDLKTGIDCYNKITKFIVKPEVFEHYTDGQLKGTDLHRIIENGNDIHLKDHVDFKKVDAPIKVVDFEVENSENYYANGRLNHNTVSGGKALAYHCSVRVRLNSVGKLKKGEVVVGNKCKAVVVKNRMGPPNRTAEFDIYYDSGIADYASWLRVLKDNGIIQQGGAYYTYNDEKFQSSDFVKMMVERPELKEELYLKICDAVIMRYKEPNSLIREDVEVDSSTEE